MAAHYSMGHIEKKETKIKARLRANSFVSASDQLPAASKETCFLYVTAAALPLRVVLPF